MCISGVIMYIVKLNQTNYKQFEHIFEDCKQYFTDTYESDDVKDVLNVRANLEDCIKNFTVYLVNKNSKFIGMVIIYDQKNIMYYKTSTSCNLSIIDLHLSSLLIAYLSKFDNPVIKTKYSEKMLLALSKSMFGSSNVDTINSSTYIKYILHTDKVTKCDLSRYNSIPNFMELFVTVIEG